VKGEAASATVLAVGVALMGVEAKPLAAVVKTIGVEDDVVEFWSNRNTIEQGHQKLSKGRRCVQGAIQEVANTTVTAATTTTNA